ncbi:LAMI_0G15830g1_1 [Lachancea mirantina]|uniref:LAMI_0G15830g1_1 n=1 Tax=Lachancea mirantina TaxID=1230905 RepID=A0A1G4KCJ7_9SACH|nr:LAMI_0G15830g1_1 [Lachancea mirantina]
MVELEHIPALFPTSEEFRDPIRFLSEPVAQRLGKRYGMVKLVPPADFKPPLSINEDIFRFKARLQNLSELDILNRGRLFLMRQLDNFHMIGKRKRTAAFQQPFVEQEGQKVHFYDVFIEVVKYGSKSPELDTSELKSSKKRKFATGFLPESSTSGHELTLTPLKDIKSDSRLWKHVAKMSGTSAKAAKLVFDDYLAPYYNYLQRKSQQSLEKGPNKSWLTQLVYDEKYPKSLLNDAESDDDEEEDSEAGCYICKRNSHGSKTILCDSCDKPFHLFCLKPALEQVPKGNWMCDNCVVGNGFYGFKEEKEWYSKNGFRERCLRFDERMWPNGDKLEDLDRLEQMFWERVKDIEKPSTIRYGADIHNEGPGVMTGFPTKGYVPPSIGENPKSLSEYLDYTSHPMNLMNLPQARGSLLSLFGKKISGMTIPWIYIGSTFSTFCWHLEDQYTLSANYQHEGDPKIWYSIPESSCSKFDNLMRHIAPDILEKQPDLLHQLVTLVAPYDKKFQDAGISCYKAIQRPGEYIITFPKCYHAGFNSGYNFNEAVNFTINSWLPYGLEATYDYIRSGKPCVFDMNELMLNIITSFLRGQTHFDNSFIRICYSELLHSFNLEMKLLDQLNLDPDIIKVVSSSSSPDKSRVAERTAEFSGNNDDDESQEGDENDSDSNSESSDDDGIFCSQCRTICPFTFVVHYNNKNRKRRRLRTRSFAEWNLRASQDEFKILCLRDYSQYFSDTELDDKNKMDSNQDKDEVHFVKDLTSIRQTLKEAQRKIDGVGR